MTTRIAVRSLILALIFVLSASAQNRFRPVYHVVRTVTLSGTAEVISVQNPMTNGKQTNIKQVFVTCSAACGFQVEMDGSTAVGGTSLAASVAKGAKRLDASRSLVVHSSPSTSPRFTIPYSLPSQGTYPIDFGGEYILPSMTTTDVVPSNFTVRTITTTGVTVTIFIQWEEP